MRMDTKEHTADMAPAPKAKAEHRGREGMGRGPTPKLRGGLIGRYDCSPLDAERLWRLELESRKMPTAQWVSHMPLAACPWPPESDGSRCWGAARLMSGSPSRSSLTCPQNCAMV